MRIVDQTVPDASILDIVHDFIGDTSFGGHEHEPEDTDTEEDTDDPQELIFE